MILTKMALRDLNLRKTRSILTILGIAIGVAAIISLFSVGYGMEDSIKDVLNDLVNLGFIVLPQSSGGSIIGGAIPLKDAYDMEEIDGVELVTPTLVELGFTEETGKNAFLVAGIPPENVFTSLPHLDSGSPWNPRKPGETCLIGSTLARSLDLSPGDEIEILKNSYDKNGLKVKVSGVLGSTGVFLEDQAVYLPLQLCQDFYSAGDTVSVVFVKIKDPMYEQSVREELYRRYPDYMIMENEDVLKNVDNILDIVDSVLLGIGGISIVVGGLSVMNSVMISVNEKIWDIGILKTIGYSKKSILKLFLLEGLLYSILGGLTGLLFGVLLSKSLYNILLTRDFILPIKYDLKVFAGSLLVSILVGISSSLYPSLKAANLRVLEAIRHV